VVSAEVARLAIEDAAGLLRERRLSPVEVTEAALARIASLARLNAFITVTAELALEQAREAEREIAAGRYRGPLHGIPVAVKDLFATAGIRTTAGSRILRDWIPEADATVVRQLRDAGAVLVGKLNMHEFAYGISSVNPHYGDVRNPYDETRIPGGSSGGSAVAVVTGMAFAAMGSDTGGSIRIPAALCGSVGIKPTYGRSSLHGVVPLAWSLDHPGPLARTVRDVAIALGATSGHDPRDPASADRPVPAYLAEVERGAKGLRVGVPRDHVWEQVAPEIGSAVRAAIDRLAGAGAEVREIAWPRAAAYAEAGRVILNAEILAVHAPTFPSRASEYGEPVRSRIAAARPVDAASYADAMKLLVDARSGLADADLDGVDVLAMPTVPERTWTIVEAKESPTAAWTRITRIFDVTGQPAISVPCGLDSAGLPIGLQLAGRLWDEAGVLRAGRAYELARGGFPPPPV